MKLLQTVVIKQIMTEKSKDELFNKYQTRKMQLQKECGQLRFEQKKLEKSKKYQAANLLNHFEKEIDSRIEKIKVIDFQIEQLHILPIGSELMEREVQAIVDVNVGDSWNDFLTGQTIVVKDGYIEEIRER